MRRRGYRANREVKQICGIVQRKTIPSRHLFTTSASTRICFRETACKWTSEHRQLAQIEVRKNLDKPELNAEPNINKVEAANPVNSPMAANSGNAGRCLPHGTTNLPIFTSKIKENVSEGFRKRFRGIYWRFELGKAEWRRFKCFDQIPSAIKNRFRQVQPISSGNSQFTDSIISS